MTWLVVSNMAAIFHNIWDNPSHWRTHILWLLHHQPVDFVLQFSSTASNQKGLFHGLFDDFSSVFCAWEEYTRFDTGQWIGLRENLNRKPIDFPIKYGAFRLRFSLKPIHWTGEAVPLPAMTLRSRPNPIQKVEELTRPHAQIGRSGIA